jgi:hypothetical protein
LFKFLLALALAFGVASVAYGSATWLKVDGNVVQAGEDTDLKCDEDGVEVLWDKYFKVVDDEPDFWIDRIKIVDIDVSGDEHNCRGAEIEVQLTCKKEGGGTEVCGPTFHTTIDHESEEINLDPDMLVKDIADVHIAIVKEFGPAGPGCSDNFCQPPVD